MKLPTRPSLLIRCAALLCLTLNGCVTPPTTTHEAHDRLSARLDLTLAEDDHWWVDAQLHWSPASREALAEPRRFAEGAFALAKPLERDAVLRMRSDGTLEVRADKELPADGIRQQLWLTPHDTADGHRKEVSLLLPRCPSRALTVSVPTDTELDVPRAVTASIKQEGDRRIYELYLHDGEELVVRWRRTRTDTAAERLVATSETRTTSVFRGGVVASRHEVQVEISQGRLPECVFPLPAGVQPVQVDAEGLRSWSLIDPVEPGGLRRLEAVFTTPRTGAVTVRIDAEQEAAGAISLGPLYPEGMVRSRGALLVGTGEALRLTVDAVEGMNQQPVAATLQAWTKKLPQPEQFRMAWQCPTLPASMTLTAETIEPVIDVQSLQVVHLDEQSVRAEWSLDLNLRDAPIQELVLEVDPAWLISEWQGEGLADLQQKVNKETGKREVRILYAARRLGRHQITLQAERSAPKSGEAWTLTGPEINDARTHRGYLLVRADTGWNLQTADEQALLPVHPGRTPLQFPDTRLAYRFKEGGWNTGLTRTLRAPSVLLESVLLVNVGDRAAKGSAMILCQVEGAPIHSLKVTLPPACRNPDWSGDGLIARPGDAEGEWELQFREGLLGSTTFLLTWHTRLSEPGQLPLAIPSFSGVSEQSGYLLLTGEEHVRLEKKPTGKGLLPISHLQVPSAWRALAHQPLMQAFQITDPQVTETAQLTFVPAARPMDSVAEYVRLDSFIDLRGDLVTRARYHVKNANAQYFAFSLPPDTDLWRIRVGNEDTQAMRGEDGGLLVPLPPTADPNLPILVELEYAGKETPSGWRPLISLACPSVQGNAGFTSWHLHAADAWRLRFVGDSTIESGTPVLGFSPFLQKWSQGFVRIAGRGPILFIALAVAGLFIMLRPLTTGIFRRMAEITFVMALLATVIQLGLHVEHFGGWPGFIHLADPGRELVLDRPVLLDGTGPQVTLQAVPAWLGTDGRVWPAGVAVVVLLIALSRAWKRGSGLGLAVWTGGLFGLWAASQVAYAVPVLPWVLCAMLLLAVLKLFHRMGVWLSAHRPEKKETVEPELDAEPAASPGRVLPGLLPVIGLLVLLAPALWASERGAPMPAPEPAPLWDRVEVSIRVEEVASERGPARQVAHLQSTFIAEPGDAATRSIPIFPGALTGIEVSKGLPAQPTSHGWSIHHNGKETIKVTATHVVPVEPGLSGFRELKLPRLHAAWRTCQLTLPKEHELTLQGEVRHFNDPATGDIRILPQLEHPLILQWIPTYRDRTDEPPRYFTRHTQRLMIDEGGWLLAQAVEVQVFQGKLRDMEWALPSGWQVLSVQAPALAGWAADEQTGRLKVQLEEPLPGNARIHLLARLEAKSLPYTMTVTLPQLLGGERDVGSVALAPAAAVTLTETTMVGATSLTPEELDTATAITPFQEQVTVHTAPVRAFRYRGDPPPLALAVAATQADIRVEEEARLDLSDERVLLATRLTLDIRNAGVFTLRLKLPEGYELETLTGAAVDRWQDHPATSEVEVSFRSKMEGQVELTLHAVRRDRNLPETLPAPRVRVVEATRHRGTLIMAARPGLQVDVRESHGLRELALERRQSGERAWRMIDADWRLLLGIRPGEPRVSATVVQQGDIRDNGVQWQAHLGFEIERVGVRELTVRSPWEDAAWHFTGEGIARVRQDPEDAHRWIITLQDRVMPKYRLTARTHRPFTPEGNVALAALTVEDVDRTANWLFVTAAASIQPLPPQAAVGLVAESPRNLPPGAAPEHLQRAHLAWRVVDTDFTLALPIRKHAAADQLPAHILGVRLQTTVALDGAQVVRTQVRLDPGRARFLDLALPPGMTLWGATVNHAAVICLQHDGRVQIPLDTAGGRTAEIDCIYAGNGTAPSDGPFALTAPGFTLPLHDVEWELHLPEGLTYKMKDGNLAEVEQDVAWLPQPDEETYLNRIEQTRARHLQRAEASVRRGEVLARKGSYDEARRLFAGAMRDSGADKALNEDARVLHLETVRRQLSAGLKERWSTLAAQRNGDAQVAPATQDISERWAERWVNQNDGHTPAAAHLRVELPPVGQRMTFRREVLTDASEPLQITLEAHRPVSRRALPVDGAYLAGGLLVGWLIWRRNRPVAA